MAYPTRTGETERTHLPRVIAVDDEPENLELIGRALRGAALVETFADPADAVNAIKRGEFDILLTDMRMPQITGTMLAEAARNANKGSVIVMITAYAETEEVLRAHESGLIDVTIAKPWEIEQLFSGVKRAALLCEMRGLSKTKDSEG